MKEIQIKMKEKTPQFLAYLNGNFKKMCNTYYWGGFQLGSPILLGDCMGRVPL